MVTLSSLNPFSKAKVTEAQGTEAKVTEAKGNEAQLTKAQVEALVPLANALGAILAQNPNVGSILAAAGAAATYRNTDVNGVAVPITAKGGQGGGGQKAAASGGAGGPGKAAPAGGKGGPNQPTLAGMDHVDTVSYTNKGLL